jgi:hypothetical protein
MKQYPSLPKETLEDVCKVIQYIARERDTDIRDWNNLQNTFVSGRKSGKIPTGSADVDPSDRVGDVNYDSSYFYIVINNGGTAAWRRIALGAW